MTEQRAEQGPKTFKDAVQASRMTPEEAQEAEREVDEEVQLGDVPEDSPLAHVADEPLDPNKPPPWSRCPQNLVIPPHHQIGYMGFKPEWTGRPDLGFRDIIFWNLSVADEKLARARARGGDALPELAKQMIRSVDGVKADWTGRKGRGSVDLFWDQVGGKCRPLIVNAYWKAHSLEATETADFFLKYSAYRTAVVG